MIRPEILSHQHHRLARSLQTEGAYSREISSSPLSHIFSHLNLKLPRDFKTDQLLRIEWVKAVIFIQCQMCRKFRIKFASYSNQFQNSFGNSNHLYFGKSWKQFLASLSIEVKPGAIVIVLGRQKSR